MIHRLTHSHEAFLRAMQMSAINVFVFVEDDSDRFFWGLLCQRAYQDVAYRLHGSRDLPGARGKPGLLAFFTFLRQASKLCHVFKAVKKASVFCLDKDIDDLTNEQIDSPHIIYGQMHSVENYLMAYGDVPRALASVVGLDVPAVVARGEFGSEWRARAADHYRRWTELCVCTRLNRLGGPCNYSSPSLIQVGPYTDVDPARHARFLGLLRVALDVGEDECGRRLSAAEELVSRLYSEGRADVVFKGKWYGYFIASDASVLFDKAIDLKSFFRALQVTLDVRASWADTFVTSLRVAWACESVT